MARRRFLRVGAAGVLLIVSANIASLAWHLSRPYLLKDPLAGSPRVFLWAWDRPEDLSFLDPQVAGVAVLAKTLILERTRISVHPRLHSVRLPADITSIAVVRIETNPSLANTQPDFREEVVRQILGSAKANGAAAIQIDFDAGISERPFYRALLQEMRASLPTAATTKTAVIIRARRSACCTTVMEALSGQGIRHTGTDSNEQANPTVRHGGNSDLTRGAE